MLERGELVRGQGGPFASLQSYFRLSILQRRHCVNVTHLCSSKKKNVHISVRRKMSASTGNNNFQTKISTATGQQTQASGKL
jgi:hypothetical protein